MPEQPLLSVLLPAHEQPEHLESMLEALLGFNLPEVEMIIIGDSTDPSHENAIRSLLDRHPNERVYFLEHEQPHGRSRCLNEALHYANGQLLWAPLRADRLNRELLREAIRKMRMDPAAFWILDRSMPPGPLDRLANFEEADLPADSQFVFNRKSIPPDQLFFNENLECFQAYELALRLMEQHSWQSTDAFFVIDKTPAPLPGPRIIQELLFTLLRKAETRSDRALLLDKLAAIDFNPAPVENFSALEKIRSLAGEDARLALGLIDNYLRENPGDERGSRLKVKILEKLRRHVEAAELKHELQNTVKIRPAKNRKTTHPMQPTLFGSLEEETSDSRSGQKSENRGSNPTAPPDSTGREQPVMLSVIIPTTGAGKPVLEECLIHLDKLCDPGSTELIVIDNASIDDTFSYLEQLQKDRFLNIRIITNSRNRGFGASANQGLDAARGKYALLMHNDLFPEAGAIEKMISLLNTNNFIGVTGPRVECDNPVQSVDNELSSDEGFVKTDYVDSCCMLIRTSTGVRFNEAYGLAFYDDADFCRRVAELGYYIAVATRAGATHRHRSTTDVLGLNLEPELRWENADIFNAKWNESPDLNFPLQGDLSDRLEAIPLPVNPLNPPGYWLDQIDAFLTDERRTEIQHRELSEEDLFRLIEILIIADKRDFLRQIETRAEGLTLPKTLLQSLIRYYYRHYIYSRCRLWLRQPEAEGPWFDLYRLRIAVIEKETEPAVGLLTGLMKHYPCHPELFRIAGDIHLAGGNEGEAKSFHALADQLEPARPGQEEEFEIKY